VPLEDDGDGDDLAEPLECGLGLVELFGLAVVVEAGLLAGPAVGCGDGTARGGTVGDVETLVFTLVGSADMIWLVSS
jgi:hypothetical protein